MSRAMWVVGTVVAVLLVAGCGPRPIGSLGSSDASWMDADQDVARPADGPADRSPERATPDSWLGTDGASTDGPLGADALAPDLPPAPDMPMADLALGADAAPADLPFEADAAPPDLPPNDDVAPPDLPPIADLRVSGWSPDADAAPADLPPSPDAPLSDSPLGPDAPMPDLPLVEDAAPDADDVPDVIDAGCACPSERPAPLALWEPPSQSGARITTVTYAAHMGLVWVGLTNGDVFYSSSGTSEAPSWSRVDEVAFPGAPSLPNLAVSGLEARPTDSKSIWVSFFGGPEGFGHKIWTTSTGGQFWGEVISSPGENIWSLSLNPLSIDVIYAVTTGEGVATVDGGVTEGILRSIDRGESWRWWTPDSQDLHTNGTNTTAVGFDRNYDPSVGMRIWTGDSTGGIWVSNVPDPSRPDSVRTWAAAGGGTPARTVNHLSVAVDAAGEHVAAAYRSWASDGIWLSDDGGQTWRNGHGACLPSTAVVYSVTINPRFPSTLYAFTSAGAWRSDDGGATWW